MHGPLLPIYGSGAITLLFTTLPVQNNIFLVFIVSCISATILEFVTGSVMESLFKVRYWDYTRYKLNYKGHICLLASMLWGFGGVGMVFGVHRPISSLVLSIPTKIAELLAFGITFAAACDFGASFREAMDVRDILIRMSEEKDKQLKRIEKRVEVMAAVYTDSFEKGKESVEHFVQEYTQKLRDIKESGQAHASELVENGKSRAEWTKAKLELLNETQKKKLQRYISTNPDAESKHVEISEMIDALKRIAFERNKRNKAADMEKSVNK